MDRPTYLDPLARAGVEKGGAESAAGHGRDRRLSCSRRDGHGEDGRRQDKRGQRADDDSKDAFQLDQPL
jgi:hypothetical protein